MRVLVVVGLAVALTAASAFGSEATITITTPGSTLVGAAHEIDASAVPDPFYVDIDVQCDDGSGMSAFFLTLTGPSSLVLAPAETFYGNILNYAGTYATGASRNSGFADLGWDQSLAGACAFLGGPLPQGGGPLDWFQTIYADPTPVFASNGWAAWGELSGTVTPGMVIGGTDEGVGDSDFAAANVTLVPLNIVPEPAGVLLLLAGLPFLRRRR